MERAIDTVLEGRTMHASKYAPHCRVFLPYPFGLNTDYRCIKIRLLKQFWHDPKKTIGQNTPILCDSLKVEITSHCNISTTYAVPVVLLSCV